MVRRDVQMASRLSDGWQPPLPETYALLTENERNDAQRLTQLQYQELRDNLERLEKEFRGGDRVTSEALKALGYFYDTRGDGKLDATDRDLAVKRFQRSLFAEGRPADRIGEPLSEEEEALANDIATGDLTDLQTVELMRQAAMRGHAPSQHIYGVMLGRGIGVRKNGREAMEMLLAAAEQDYALAHYSAGIFYIEGITATESLRPSKREACFHLRSAAVLDYAKAEDAQRDYCK
jgi:TPR repeat protein